MNVSNYLITWFYAENKDNESFYPQVGGKSSSFYFQKVYWKCIYCFFRSAIITNEASIEYLFFTNTNIPTDIDGVNIEQFFRDNNIKVIRKELSKQVPKDWYGAWRNQFYIFDILETLKDYSGNHLILDSDCIISESLDNVFNAVNQFGNIAYNVEGNGVHPINGITQSQMRQLYRNFFNVESPCEDLFYCGGEIVAIKSALIPQALKVFENIWEKNFIRYQNNEFKLNEEAHFLTLIYYRLGILNNIASKYIKRLWTTKIYDNVKKKDLDKYIILHLLSEKQDGFVKLFHYFQRHNTITKANMYRKIDQFIFLRHPLIRKLKKHIMQNIIYRRILKYLSFLSNHSKYWRQNRNKVDD